MGRQLAHRQGHRDMDQWETSRTVSRQLQSFSGIAMHAVPPCPVHRQRIPGITGCHLVRR
jgi:hypothetical protein